MGSAACHTDFRYFIWMPRKDRKPTPKSSGDRWFVYLVRALTGRCTPASQRTWTVAVAAQCRDRLQVPRSRRPVRLTDQESSPSQSSALKREAAIKAMTRREKLAMCRPEFIEMERKDNLRRAANELLLIERAKEWLLEGSDK